MFCEVGVNGTYNRVEEIFLVYKLGKNTCCVGEVKDIRN